MARLEKWYMRKSLTPDQLNTWFEAVCHIPNEPFAAIMQDCIEGERYFPTPSTVKRMWVDWRRNHPERIIDRVDIIPCRECDGTGIITWYKRQNGTYYEFGDACGVCENWQRSFPTKGENMPKRITRPDIEAMGGLLKSPYEHVPNRGRALSVDEAIDMAAKSMAGE